MPPVLTVAILVAALLQVPPAVASVSVMLPPTQIGLAALTSGTEGLEPVWVIVIDPQLPGVVRQLPSARA